MPLLTFLAVFFMRQKGLVLYLEIWLDFLPLRDDGSWNPNSTCMQSYMLSCIMRKVYYGLGLSIEKNKEQG